MRNPKASNARIRGGSRYRLAAVLALVFLGGAASGEILYSVSWSLDTSFPPSKLWRHDIPVTPGEPIGSTGRYGVWGLAVEPGTTRIFATAPTTITSPVGGDDLLELDPTNGQATVIAQILWSDTSSPVPVVGMLAFDDSGTLYGVSYMPDLDGANDYLATIDTSTGLATRKSSPLGVAVNGGDISFAADGTLMSIMTVLVDDSGSGGEGEGGEEGGEEEEEPSGPSRIPALFIIDRATGEANYVNDIWPSAYSNCPGLAHLTDGTMVSAGVINLDENGNTTDGFIFMIHPGDGHAEPISTKGYAQNIGDFAAMRTPVLVRLLWQETFGQ